MIKVDNVGLVTQFTSSIISNKDVENLLQDMLNKAKIKSLDCDYPTGDSIIDDTLFELPVGDSNLQIAMYSREVTESHFILSISCCLYTDTAVIDKKDDLKTSIFDLTGSAVSAEPGNRNIFKQHTKLTKFKTTIDKSEILEWIKQSINITLSDADDIIDFTLKGTEHEALRQSLDKLPEASELPKHETE